MPENLKNLGKSLAKDYSLIIKQNGITLLLQGQALISILFNYQANNKKYFCFFNTIKLKKEVMLLIS